MKSTTFLRSLQAVALIVLPIFLSSCGPTLQVTSNTFADSCSIPRGFRCGSSFSLAALDEQDNHMFSKEVLRKIAILLQDRGYRVKKAGHADYHLVFSFGMTSSTQVRQIWTYVPGPSQRTYGTVYDQEGAVNYQEETQASGSMVPVPQEFTLYHRELEIKVYDDVYFRKTNKQRQVWQGEAESSGKTGELREIIDYLLVTAFKHFGRNTQKTVSTTMPVKDQEVAYLRRSCFHPFELEDDFEDVY